MSGPEGSSAWDALIDDLDRVSLRRDELRAALTEARQALVDVTCVGISIDAGPHGKESRMRQIACAGIFEANKALNAATPTRPVPATRGGADA